MKNTKYLVTELTKENKQKVKLKAKKLGLSIDELIVSSIDAYSPIVICNGKECDKENPTTIYKHEVTVGVNTLMCIVENTPTVYCDSCSNSETFDVEFIAILNELIEQIMIQLFIKTKNTSFKFDYNKLETMN